ncbi:MAG: Hsp20/alpha crystallin family protein [Candidatus Dormibacteria bacterium]
MSHWLHDSLTANDHAPAVHLPVDIRQTDTEYILEASVPGFTPEGIEVVSENGVLTIRGRRKVGGEPEVRYLRQERRQFSFFRQVLLPQEVREAEIRAHFVDGVLSVRIPRVETAAPRRVKIEVGSPPAALETAASLTEPNGTPSRS